ncbi:MAG: hypothetical protein HYW48_03815 [Deltaproteobacteria bacterium]|nr:hypothetical protein [Deltaproteobacteria bacterium]
MFRLFIVEQVQSGKDMQPRPKPKLPAKQYRNRRLYERFEVDHKHLALMNEQDIFVIRDLSKSGFSCEVSDRSFSRITVGDVYKCRMRYLNEIYDIHAQLVWKANKFVGFSIQDPSSKILGFLERVLDPIHVGSSLKLQNNERAPRTEGEPIWFKAEGSQLFIWEDAEGSLKSWRLEYDINYVAWDHRMGPETGVITEQGEQERPWDRKREKDYAVDKQKRQFAVDSLMVLDFVGAQKLIQTIA